MVKKSSLKGNDTNKKWSDDFDYDLLAGVIPQSH